MSGQPLALRTETLGEWLPRLTVGERVTLTGAVYATGVGGHRRLRKLLEEGKPLPIDLGKAVLCCGGPEENREGRLIWDLDEAGSTDRSAPVLMDHGLRAMVGRGDRSDEVVSALIRNRGVYFAAFGSVAALNGTTVKTAQTVAFEDLGEGALKRLGLLELPLVVAIDAAGGNLYRRGPARYKRQTENTIW